MSLWIAIELGLAVRDFDTRKDEGKLTNRAACKSRKQNMQKTFLFCSEATSSLLLNSAAVSSKTTHKLGDRAWQELFSAPKIQHCGQAYTYMVKIFSSPEQGEFIFLLLANGPLMLPLLFHKQFLSACAVSMWRSLLTIKQYGRLQNKAEVYDLVLFAVLRIIY